MEKGVKIQITLAPVVAESLDEFCRKKGLKRSAAVALALNELWKEERTDEK
nr:unnamed protein product [uncultured bacterium]